MVPGMTRRVLRMVSALVAAAVLNLSLMPLAQALQHERARATALPQANDELRYAEALQGLHAALSTDAARPGLGGRGLQALPGNADTFDAYARQIQAQWDALHATWQAAGVDAGLLADQAQMQAAFHERHARLTSLLRQWQADPTDMQARAQLKAFLDEGMPSARPSLLQPDRLPWRVLPADRSEPALDAAALENRLGLPVASTSGNTSVQASGRTFTARSSAHSPPGPADLAPTQDAPHTPAITALAARLEHTPHKIYQWVHDNIHYTPTHGSVQGAQDTLDKKAGNAFDTASLLVALLRASGMPARYIYGTVEIPAQQAMNWVGGAQTLDAAQQILAQGGVRNAALVSGGTPVALRMEHVWVETLIQYHPGRGARHVPGQSQPDTWVPMDGSFKQYRFTEGMDLQAAVPLDTQALLDAATQGARSNAAEGWVQHLDTTALQGQLAAYQQRLKTYIDSRNGGQSTVGEVLGTRDAVIDPLPYLAGALPYTIKARSRQFSDIPANLRHQFRYQIFTDASSASWGDNPLLSFTAPTATLAGKKLTLAWVAASEADQKAIEALLPRPAAGQSLRPEDLPGGLSSSIRLKPQIRVEGTVVAEGGSLRAGSEPVGVGGFTRYGSWQWDETQDGLIAGQQTALGLSIQGVSQAQIQALKTRMEQTQARLQQAQAAPDQRETILQGMTGEHLTGDLLTATLWGWFASVQSHGAIASRQAQVFDLPALSYGLFHAQVRPNKLYGLVTTGITFQGLNMDIGHMRHMRWVKDDNPQSAINANPELTANGRSAAQNRWIAYNKMRGQYASAMEHAVPEAFWVDKTQCRYTDDQGTLQNPGMADCAQGISAVKAIAIAQSEGQKIYTVTQDNAATALHKLPIGGSVGAEIRSAVQAGKEVTVHERAINAHGWSGYGYIVTDPETGAGGYIIEGKGNGGILMILAGVALAIASMYISSINPVWGILLLSISLMVVGCGLSWNFNDSRYFDIYMGISMTLIGALLSTAGAGIAAEIIPLILGSILTIGNVSSKCSK
jgi:transglutaminase-like putative cysteine protease